MNNGLLVLDAHLSPLDILMTAKWIRARYPNREILMPVAGYALHVPLMKNIFQYFATSLSIKFLQVYRKEELDPKNILMRVMCIFYPTKLTDEERRLKNNLYLKTATEILKNDGIVIVAPYGSPILYGKKIKYGVIKLVELLPELLLTRSRFSIRKMKYITNTCKVGAEGWQQKLSKKYQELASSI